MNRVERNQRVAGKDPVKALSRRIEHGPVEEGREIVESTHFADLVNAISERIKSVETDKDGIVRIALHGDVLWQPNILPLRSSRYKPDRAKLQMIARSAALTAAMQSGFSEQDLGGYVDFRELETEVDLALNPHPWYQRGKDAKYSLQSISLKEALEADPQELVKKAEGEKFKYRLAPSASVLAATATACALTAQPPPAVTVTVEAPSRPTAEVTKTPTPPPTPEATQEVYDGTTDISILAVPGVPEGFGGKEELAGIKNTTEIQGNLNDQGYAPIVDSEGNLAYEQAQDGTSVCIAPLPDQTVREDNPEEANVRLGGEGGVVEYGDRVTGEVRLRAVGAVSLSGYPSEWSCAMGVVTDEENPAGLGALRMLLIDGSGNIKGEMQAAFDGSSDVKLDWQAGGPRLVVDGQELDFELREGVALPNTRFVEDYLGQGPAEITVLEESEDITGRVLIEPWSRENVFLTDNVESDFDGTGALDKTPVQGLMLTHKQLEKVVINPGGVAEKSGYQMNLTFVYQKNGMLHTLMIQPRGIMSFNGGTMQPIEEVYPRISVGSYTDLLFRHVNPGSTFNLAGFENFVKNLLNGDEELKSKIEFSLIGFGTTNFTMGGINSRLSDEEALFSPYEVWISTLWVR